MTVTHNGKQYTTKKLNDNEWQLTSVRHRVKNWCLTAGRCISLASWNRLR